LDIDMRLLFLGDIVGRAGRIAVLDRLPGLRERWRLDCVVINGENSAGGFGITEAICDEILAAGADVVTLGNHSWDQREAMVFIERQPRLIRPANFPPGTPGRGAAVVEAANGARVLVVNVMGRLFMDPLDDPFAALERELAACPLRDMADAVIVDVHAEATSEKLAMAYYLDGRASLVVGTHTHVPTADTRLLPAGTAYQSDAGMCGDYDSILGMQKEEAIRRFLQKTPGARLEPALGEGALSGVAVETDDRTGLATAVWPVRLGPNLEQAWPTAWEKQAG
jgi:metallophosphoesterase (TIGR00282 family)